MAVIVFCVTPGMDLTPAKLSEVYSSLDLLD